MRTIFNLLGPLTNPAGARHQLIGVSDAALRRTARPRVRADGQRARLVVHGDDGLDEISTTCATHRGRGVRRPGLDERYEVTPEEFGVRAAPLEDLARRRRGRERGARCATCSTASRGRGCDIVLFNAGAALFIAEAAGSIADGVEKARAAVDSGAARAKLDALVATTRRLARDA